MRIQKQDAFCRKCETVIAIELVVEAPVKLFLQSIDASCCDQCGAGVKHIDLIFDIGAFKKRLAATPREGGSL